MLSEIRLSLHSLPGRDVRCASLFRGRSTTCSLILVKPARTHLLPQLLRQHLCWTQCPLVSFPYRSQCGFQSEETFSLQPLKCTADLPQAATISCCLQTYECLYENFVEFCAETSSQSTWSTQSQFACSKRNSVLLHSLLLRQGCGKGGL